MSLFLKNDSESLYSVSFINHSQKSNSNSGLLAFYMLKFLLGRLLYSKGRYLKTLKFRALIRWKYFIPKIQEHPIDELILKNSIKTLKKSLKLALKKSFIKWFQSAKILKMSSKFQHKKSKKQEIHNGQVMQMKRVLTQMHLKKAEAERELEHSVHNEKKIKEVNGKSMKSIKRKKTGNEALRKVIQENEDLKDKLEVLHLSVNELVRDVSMVLKSEVKDRDGHRNDDGLEESQLRTSRRKKLSGIIR